MRNKCDCFITLPRAWVGVRNSARPRIKKDGGGQREGSRERANVRKVALLGFSRVPSDLEPRRLRHGPGQRKGESLRPYVRDSLFRFDVTQLKCPANKIRRGTRVQAPREIVRSEERWTSSEQTRKRSASPTGFLIIQCNRTVSVEGYYNIMGISSV